ncbi:hypothetical protein PG984_006905 [Apiospora sp. TS-2023a]
MFADAHAHDILTIHTQSRNTPNLTWSKYPTVCRKWQHQIERFSFQELVLTNDRMADAQVILTRQRLNHVRTIELSIRLPSYDEEAHTRDFFLLLKTLSDSAPDNKVLKITAYSRNDIWHRPDSGTGGPRPYRSDYRVIYMAGDRRLEIESTPVLAIDDVLRNAWKEAAREARHTGWSRGDGASRLGILKFKMDATRPGWNQCRINTSKGNGHMAKTVPAWAELDCGH